MDIYQDKDEIILKASIAGVKQKDLEVTISSDTIVISGEKKANKKVKEKNYFYRECYYGKFARSVVLPFDVDEAGARANLEDGILTIILPIVKK